MRIALALCALLLVSGATLEAADTPKADPSGVLKKIFKNWDTNNDGKLSKDEVSKGGNSDRAKDLFAEKDKNKDGFLSLDEFTAVNSKKSRK